MLSSCVKLCGKVLGEKGAGLNEYYDLVAIGTIADIVPLTGENRLLAKLGLAELSRTSNLGLKALLKTCRLESNDLNSGKVGFIIAPRLNAAGRISHAAAGVELLVTEDQTRAEVLAAELEEENLRRQSVEKELLAIAETLLSDREAAEQKVLVLAGEEWHPGVIGIVASRLVDQHYRPVVMISIHEGIGKGSCRSIPGFDIYQALGQCADLLIQYGGHKQAAGLTIAIDQITCLRERLNKLAAEWLTENDFIPVLNIDSQMGLEEITEALLEQLACLAPHGMGNPSPVFASMDLSLAGIRPLGQEGRHCKLKVKQNGSVVDVLAWNMADLTAGLNGGCLDLAFVPEFSRWNGQRSIQLTAKDFKKQECIYAGVILQDARNTINKIAFVGRLAQAGNQVLVFVNERCEAVKLAFSLRGIKGVACYEAAMSSRRKELLAAAWRHGRLKVLVAVDFVDNIIATEHIVLYHPPINWELLHSCLRQLPARQVCLYYLFER